jgi:protein O-GlcNAc transferase
MPESAAQVQMPVSPTPAETMLQNAGAFRQSGRLDEEEAVYRDILQLEPKNIDALYWLAVVSFQRGHIVAALESIGKAIAIKPTHVNSHVVMGNFMHGLKRHEEALEAYRRALELKPDFAEVIYNRSLVLHELDRDDEALANCDRALLFKPDYVDALLVRGSVLRKPGRREEALASYDRALHAAPDHADANDNRGRVLADLNRIEEALVSLRPVFSSGLAMPRR